MATDPETRYDGTAPPVDDRGTRGLNRALREA
jgi:hypothetical protein